MLIFQWQVNLTDSEIPLMFTVNFVASTSSIEQVKGKVENVGINRKSAILFCVTVTNDFYSHFSLLKPTV